MAKQNERKMCSVYIAPEERRLLAQVARGHGVGLDYLALLAIGHKGLRAAKRAIPRWLAARLPNRTPQPTARRKVHTPRSRPQERHCRTCANVSPVALSSAGQAARRYVCAAGVWTSPMQEQSLRNSRRLRSLSLTCARYSPLPAQAKQAPHHCRACRELARAGTPDERYICGCGVWTNPMKPQSVANARRLARLSAACPHFAATTGRWLPRR